MVEKPVDTYDINNSQSRASFLTGLNLSLVLEKELMIVQPGYILNRRHY
jgi:hypothetical protein